MKQASTGGERARSESEPIRVDALPSFKPELEIVPMSLTSANAMVGDKHRHNAPLRSFLVFAVGVKRLDTGVTCGAALIGHASSKVWEDGFTLEVRRAVTDGTPNANSALYGAACRAAKALGYKRLLTFTLVSESGASLRGAGWKDDGLATSDITPEGLARNPHAVAALERGAVYPIEQKRRWVKIL